MNNTESSSLQPSAWTSMPAPGIHLGGGTRSFCAAQQAHENLGPGMKLALLLEGSFSLDIDNRAGKIVTAATSSLFVSRDDWRLDHHFPEGTRLHYLTLFLDAVLIEDMLEEDLPQCIGRGDFYHAVRNTPPAMGAIATSLLHRPFCGAAGRLHDSGKALELAALAIEAVARKRPNSQASLANAGEIQRIHQLREFLDSHWRDAPSVDVLARQFGFGVRKMTVVFRRLFGLTISEHLRELRLQEAWRLLDSGMSATLVAEEVGYTHPHFTVAFTRRFGITPGSLSGHGMR